MQQPSKTIPLFSVFMSHDVDKPLLEVLHSGYIGQGKQVEEFEAALAASIGNPYVLTLNSATSGLHLAYRLAGVTQGTEVITTPQTCLWSGSMVLLPDGKTKRISTIVNKRLALEVMSFDPRTKTIVPKKVVNWIKLPATTVSWYRLSREMAQGTNGTLCTRGVWVTGDHKVYSQRGIVRADSLNPAADKLLTVYKQPNAKQAEFIDGTLLGDGHLDRPVRPKSGHSRLSVGHTTRQREWVDIKSRALKGIPLREWTRHPYKQTGETCGFETKKLPFFRRQYHRWYSKNKGIKQVPDDLSLTPLVLATWFMDDGCYTKKEDTSVVVLCTDGFDCNANWKLFWKLTDVGFRPRMVFQRKRKTYRLSITTDDLHRFFMTVAPYIPPTMRYKLPAGYPDYDPSLWDLGEAEVFYDKVTVMKGQPSVDRRYVYCLEVEDTHNFITSGIVVSNCAATNLPILANGGKIIWADIDPDTGLIAPADVERKITSTTKAIVCVDWGGTPCNLDRLMDIGKRHGIPVIEDAAHSFGATYKGRKIGTIADFTVFSYQAIKTLTTVDGGALVVKDPERYRRGKLLRWYGIDRESPRTTDSRIEEDIAEYGYKFHMNDVTATIGLHQLPHLEDTLTRHRANAASYQSRIDDRFYTHPRIGDYAYTGSYWLYTILLPDQEQRLAFMRFMAEHGVMVSQVHSRNDTHTAFRESRTELPGVTAFCERQVSIPVHWALTQEQRQTIVDLCNEFAKQAV